MNRITEKLWFRPLIFLFTIYIRANRKVADSTRLHELVPKINTESLETLLGTISASVSDFHFAVGSMVSAFSAASSTATPRSFKLIIGDDVSRNALSVL
jgi:uncharacterized membrane protein